MNTMPSTEPTYAQHLDLLEEMRVRLYRRRDASLRDPHNFAMPESISVCEGGCLFPTHPSVVVAATRSLLNSTVYPTHIYPQSNEAPAFLDSIRRYFGDVCGIADAYTSNIAFGIGISQLFDAFIPSVCTPGDIILAPESYYHAFVAWSDKWGVAHLRVQTRAANGFKVQADELDAWFAANPDKAPRTRALLLTNPTTAGAVYSQAELDALAAIVARRGIYVFVDEVFRDTEFGTHKTVSLASVPAAAPWCVTAHSGSKARGAANYRIGWCCGPQALIKKIRKHCEKTVTEYPFHIQAAGQAVLELPPEYVAHSIEELGIRVWQLLDAVAAQNAMLRRYFGIDFDIIETPVMPHGGHSLLLCLEALRGATKPKGGTIETPLDLTEYFFDFVDEDGSSCSICLSTGSTKGHDDLICYLAFSQTGHEYMAAAAEPHIAAYVQNHVFGDATAVYAPDFSKAVEYGRMVNAEAVRRLGRAVRALKLVKAA